MGNGVSLGVMFRREYPAAQLPTFAARAEVHGLSELWVVEDLGYHGGFAQVATALAATQHISVGLGIAPAVAGNVAYTAMEVATLGAMHPGRFHMGFGHGVAEWMAQVGATPASWLASLREVTAATIALVDGETVTMQGEHVHLDGVRLHAPAPSPRPLVSLGVRGPKSMALAADVADGVILAEGSGPRYVADVREQLGGGRITVFVWASADTTALDAELDRKLALRRFDVQLAPYADVARADLLRHVAITGDSSTWAEQAEQWRLAGADAVVFTPLPSDPAAAINDWRL